MLFAAMVMMMAVAAQAKTNPLRVKSGTLKPLKSGGGTIEVVFDFSKTRGNRKPLEQHLQEDFNSSMEEFRENEPEMRKWFCERWNDDIEKGPKIGQGDGTTYQMTIVIKNLQMGAISGYGGASISGYAEVFRRGESEPFAVIEILKLSGTQLGTAIAGYPGLHQAFNDLAEYMCDLIYHY